MTLFEPVLRSLLADGIGVRFRAGGDSMYPTIHDGELVEVVPCDPASLRRGDVVLAQTTRGLTLHRIVSISSSGVLLRGDNALGTDGPVMAGAVLGITKIGKQITKDCRSLDGSVKIICAVATFIRRLSTFVRRLRSRIQQQFQR